VLMFVRLGGAALAKPTNAGKLTNHGVLSPPIGDANDAPL
jgi:hypothetical protein